MLLYYFSLWQNRDSPSGLAVESPCTVPVSSTVAFCKDRTRHTEFRSGGLTRNARRREEESKEKEKEDTKRRVNKPERLMGVNVIKRSWKSERKEEWS